MWTMAVSAGEIVLRTSLVYIGLIILLRISGKRQVGQLAPFDLVLLLVLANAVQNSMTGGDNSLQGGLLSAAALVGLNWIVSFATFRSKKLESMLEGRPQVLIHNGVLHNQTLQEAHMTHHELQAALRRAGCACVEDVQVAVLENNGAISVVPKKA